MHQEEIIRKTDLYLQKFENNYKCRLSWQARVSLQREIITFSLGEISDDTTQSGPDYNTGHRIALAKLRLRLREFARAAPECDSLKGGSTIIRKWEIIKWIRECRCWPR